MVDKKVRLIMRGHLISLDKEATLLRKPGDEYFRTKYYGVITGYNQISFKRFNKINTFKFSEIKKFFLKDSTTFVIQLHDVKKRFSFTIV